MKNLLCKKLATCLYTTRVHSEREQSQERNKENEIMQDWMLAAAVLDRFCAIAFTAVFIAGTIAFLTVFVAHP